MISKKDFIVIHELYNKGYSIRKISKILKLDRRTISKHLKNDTLTSTKRISKKPAKLDPYKPYITELINNSTARLPCSAILGLIRQNGYSGGRSMLQRYLAVEYKKLSLTADPIVRYETIPGEQAQADWTTIRSGKTPIYAFVITLGYSRLSYVRFTKSCKDEDLLYCLEKSFAYFNGVPKTILYDNMKSVVIKRDAYGVNHHQFNRKMLDYSKLYGFKIKLCRPYRAKTKGKVERFNRYLKENFYRTLVARLANSSIDINVDLLNSHINDWLSKVNRRIHGTTRKIPLKEFNDVEQATLLPYMEVLSTNVEIIKRMKGLPEVTVSTPNINIYDQLLGVEV
jgi:transposase